MSGPESAKGLLRVAILFLYTNSPGQLHYTFAYFQCGNTCEEQNRGGSGRRPDGKRRLRSPNPGIGFQIKSS